MLGIAAALLGVVAVAPAPAAADELLAASGSLTYTWHGDPTRGCAAADLCGVEGALIVEAAGATTASSFGGNTEINVDFSGSMVRVLGGPGAVPGACVDVPSGIIASALIISHARHGRLVGRIEPPPSSGQCAGPTEQDLGRIAIPVSRTGTTRPSFDLRATRTFAAGPFSGTLVSTLVLRHPKNSGVAESSTGSGTVGGGPPPTQTHLLERVALRYRLASRPGALDVAFSGRPDPFCTALGSCGATGSLALTLPGLLDRSLTITASRPVGRRVGARQALADLRRGRLSFEVGVPPPSPAPLTTQVSESFQGQDGSRCADTTEAQGALLLFEPAPREHGLSVMLSDPNESGVLRTHCPGPGDSDAFSAGSENPFGGTSGVARGLISPAALTRRHVVVSLTRPGSFTGFGYVGTRTGAIRLSLSLERVVHAGTIQVTR